MYLTSYKSKCMHLVLCMQLFSHLMCVQCSIFTLVHVVFYEVVQQEICSEVVQEYSIVNLKKILLYSLYQKIIRTLENIFDV